MQNKSVNILFTRQLEGLLMQKAALKNILIDTVNFIVTEPVTDAVTIEKIVAYGHQKITAIFTSTNAVEAVQAQLLNEINWDIYCIGGATKDAVIDIFGETKIKAVAKSAANLGDKIITANNVDKLVFFCGDQRLTTLPETLTANGIEVNEVIVYQTILTPQIVEKNYNGIAFFSPSAVHSFFSENTTSTNVIMFAIGKTTAATLASYCTNQIVTCEWPGSEQMVEAINQYFEKN
ncbi:MAG: uroporphyrinogen-III synthase [Deinococcales bacterium]|nr:uroporphyrinogen-III synthase [Chitinophagaceae bacterium]